MDKPYLSVIIPIHNRENDVAGLMSSLLRQDYAAEKVEYLIVDNRSNDRTGKLLEEALRATTDRARTFRVIREDRIQSSYAARNKGILAAQGEILIFTDSDCRPQPDWLSALELRFSAEGAGMKVGLVAGRIDPLPGNTIVERYSRHRRLVTQETTFKHRYRPYGQTANLAVRREVFETIGLFRPYLTTGGDADLCWRASEKGWNLIMAPEAVVQHRHRRNLFGLAEQYRRYAIGQVYLNRLYNCGLPLMASYPKFLIKLILNHFPKSVVAAVRRRDPTLPVFIILELTCFVSQKAGLRAAQRTIPSEKIQYFDESAGHFPSEVRS